MADPERKRRRVRKPRGEASSGPSVADFHGGKLQELPKKLIRIPNADKAYHERWFEGRDALNIPHPWRAVLAGPPHVGKSTTVKNLILRADPPFERVVCVHIDCEGTKEYDDVEAEMMSDIPDPQAWDGEAKTLCILDDIDCKALSKAQKHCLDRLFGYASTHKNCSVALCMQDAFSSPPIVRRCANLLIIWKSPDADSMAVLSRKSGLGKTKFDEMLDKHLKSRWDSLWIDSTQGSPYPLRVNGYDMVAAE